MANSRPINHHQNPWIFRGILLGLAALVLVLLTYAVFRPDESAAMKRDSAALTAQMAAAEARSEAAAAHTARDRASEF